MTAPKLPEGLEPVAFARKWWADGEKAVKVNGKWPGKFKLHAVRERQCLPDDAPLVRLSDAQAALQALAAEKDAEIAALKKQLKSWLVANGRGGWIDRLRNQAEAEAIRAALAKEKQ